jgi:biotin transport system substrate-specific component
MHDYRARPQVSATVLLDLVTARARAAAATRSIQVASVLFLAALTAAAAQVSVPLPFTPVPFTLQPMVVLLGAAALGSRLGALSQVLYLAAGIVGLQVFAFSPLLPQGAGRLLGPTGGFLLAYPLAAFVTGWLAERRFDRRYATSVVAMLAGLAVVFAGGISWLALMMPGAIGLQPALAAAFYPFVLADVAKVLLAAALLPTVWSFVSPGGGFTKIKKY